jgi:hypothetical protein
VKILCKIFGHKWPYMTSVLQIMGAIEAKNNLPCRTVIKCLRGCGATRDLTEEAVSTYRRANMIKIERIRNGYLLTTEHEQSLVVARWSVQSFEAVALAVAAYFKEAVTFYVRPQENGIAMAEQAEAGQPPTETSDNISRAEICEWKSIWYSWGEGFKTNCGESVQTLLDIRDMKFCPYCSRKLRLC